MRVLYAIVLGLIAGIVLTPARAAGNPNADLCGMYAAAAGLGQDMRADGMSVPDVADFVNTQFAPEAEANGVTPHQWKYIVSGFTYALQYPPDANPEDVAVAAFRQCVSQHSKAKEFPPQAG